MGTYEDVFRASVDDPEAFWLGAAEAIDWYSAPTRALDGSNPPFYRWFPDGQLNVCNNALDRHVDAGRGEQAALIYDSPVTGTGRTYTYEQLRDETAAFAGVLTGLGVGHGDRVVIYMPMVPEAAIAMLACARIGAVPGLRRYQGCRAAAHHLRRRLRPRHRSIPGQCRGLRPPGRESVATDAPGVAPPAVRSCSDSTGATLSERPHPGQVSQHPGLRGPWPHLGATVPGRCPSRWTAGSPRRPDAPSPAPPSARRSVW